MMRRTGLLILTHACKLALTGVNLLLNRPAFFRLVGIINRNFHFLNSVFVAYPATQAYANAYSYKWQQRKYQWQPFIAGIFYQNGKWGLMTAIPNTERDFYDPQRREDLRTLVARVKALRDRLGAAQTTFAGILPSLLNSLGYLDSQTEAEVTIEAVLKAEQSVRSRMGYPKDVPLIILGTGFIGSKLLSRFNGRIVFGIDIHDGWPHHLQGYKTILINLSRQSVLKNYLHLLWPELVILNEVYPEPGQAEIATLRRIGCRAYHIVGVEGKSYPPLPNAYGGGIPCCAAWNAEHLKVVIRELN